MVQYYTLEQAAQILQTTPDKVKEMAKKNELCAFQDRGNLRFRAQEIDELARTRGLGSDPALTPGPGPSSPPPSSRRKSKIPPQQPIAMTDDDEAPIGKETMSPGSKGGPSSSGRKSASPGKSPVRKPTMAQPGPKSPPPRTGTDSDVRLVADGSDLDFQVASEEPKSGPGAGSPSSKSGPKKSTRPSKLGKSADLPDSGVRIVPLDDASDSDVKLEPDAASGSAVSGPSSKKRPSDSDIRLEEATKEAKKGGKPKSGEHPITEEIDLDEEQRRADAAARTRPGAGKGRPKPNPLNLPTSSPFELSEGDIDMEKPAARKPKARPSKVAPEEKKGETDSSSDFELTPVGDADSSPLELGSSEVEALPTDDSDEVSLGGELTGAGAAKSGINLQDPADSGISLEQGGSDEIEFELSLDSGATPKPGPVSEQGDSSSEFELTAEGEGEKAAEESSEFELALESADAPAGEEESSSEFELSLDVDDGSSETEAAEGSDPDSDSEFELTLDADGGLEASDETDALAGGDEKDIFETDFEVPALEEEESGSGEAALEDEDTDLETSDFDLALDEEGGEEDLESGSQVVALEDEEDIDEGAETEARPRRRAAVDEEDEESELDLEIDPNAEPEEEEEEEAAVGAAAAPPAQWGPLPALLLIPTVLVMFFVGLLAFELAGTMWNYRQPGHTTGFGIVLQPIAKAFDPKLPD